MKFLKSSNYKQLQNEVTMDVIIKPYENSPIRKALGAKMHFCAQTLFIFHFIEIRALVVRQLTKRSFVHADSLHLCLMVWKYRLPDNITNVHCLFVLLSTPRTR